MEGARVQEALQAALSSDSQTLVSEDEITAIQEALSSLAEMAKGEEIEAIKQVIESVDKASQLFAER
ncbi:MAG: molecular chaperone HscA [Paraglaciecola sp.]